MFPAASCAVPIVDAGGAERPLRYLGSEPNSLDPARANDAGTIQVLLQLYAGLTRLDENVEPYPSLAESWEISEDRTEYRFTLRERLQFSDGTPLDATDVARSWLRLLDPATGGSGAAMLADVAGATAFATGEGEAEDVGIEVVDPRTLVVTLSHPASYFPAVLATPATFVVPRSADEGSDWVSANDFVGSGPYVVDSLTPSELVLRGNEHYVHGPPSIDEVRIVSDLGDSDAVTAFTQDEIDVAGIPGWDAAWVRYDAEIGPHLHQADSLSIEYFGFDTTRPPFDDARVRRAFLLALDRPRLVELAAGSSAEPASSLVPPALWPEGMEADEAGDPEEARELLADAGYEDGADLGELTVSLGGFGAPGVIETWREELGVEIELETMEFDEYFAQLEEEPPHIFTVIWIADYPTPQALYGLLLGPGSDSNWGRWVDSDFSELLQSAAAADTENEQAERFIAVDEYVDEQAPVIPYAYGEDWWLVRDGLRGARTLTLQLLDFGALSWSD